MSESLGTTNSIDCDFFESPRMLNIHRKIQYYFYHYNSHYSPILTSEGSKVRRFHGVACEMEIRIIPLIAHPLQMDKAHRQK